MRFIGVCALLGVLVGLCINEANAQCKVSTYSYGHGNYNYGSYYTPTYTYATATTYVPVYYPAYSIGYDHGNQPSLEKELLKLKIELKDMQIQSLKEKLLTTPAPGPMPGIQPGQNPPPPVPPFAGPPPGAAVQIMISKCAKCHDESKAKESGSNFVLLKNAGFGHLDAAQKLKVLSSTYKGTMPKGGKPLSDEEMSILVKELTGN